jgi:hypothetical protein
MADNFRKALAHRPSRHPRRRDRHRHPAARAVEVRRPYDRRTELPRILPLWPHELADESPEGRRRVLGQLRAALRVERRRGIAGHWTYDLARHVELLRVYRCELAARGGGRRE